MARGDHAIAGGDERATDCLNTRFMFEQLCASSPCDDDDWEGRSALLITPLYAAAARSIRDHRYMKFNAAVRLSVITNGDGTLTAITTLGSFQTRVPSDNRNYLNQHAVRST